jgi:ketosteroid isomerase-like protein
MSETNVAWLRDLEELRRLTQRYARAIDARDIDAVSGLFDPDGVVEGVRGTSTVAAYLDGLRNAERAFGSSMHVLGDPLIELEPGTDAGRMDTYAVVHQLDPVADGEGDLLLGIRYLDDVVRSEARWVISHRRALVLWTRRRLPRHD